LRILTNFYLILIFKDIALESSAVLELLQDKFISSWSLVIDLEKCSNDSSLAVENNKLCQTLLDAYHFPVMSMVLSSNGTLIHSVNANDLLDSAHQGSDSFMNSVIPPDPEKYIDPIAVAYRDFLAKSIRMS
jgi:hypothetical protein